MWTQTARRHLVAQWRAGSPFVRRPAPVTVPAPRFSEFVTYTKPDYVMTWFHEVVADALERLATGEMHRLLLFLPPRHGKTELASRRFVPYLFGTRPDAHVIACSYSAALANRSSRDVQRIMDSPRYASVFPRARLASSPRDRASRTTSLFEIVGTGGSYRAAGVGGGITGMGMDVGIIDDPVKNQEEAHSLTVRQKQWDWFTSTFYTRLEKNGSLLVVSTRWHEDDLAGRILRFAGELGGPPGPCCAFLR